MALTAGGFLAGITGGLDATTAYKKQQQAEAMAALEFQRKGINDANLQQDRIQGQVSDIQKRIPTAGPAEMEGIVREIDYLAKTVDHRLLPDEFLNGTYGGVAHNWDQAYAAQGPVLKEGDTIPAQFSIENTGAGASDIATKQERTIGEGDATLGKKADIHDVQRAARERGKRASQLIGSVVGLRKYGTEHGAKQAFWRTSAYGNALDFLYQNAGSIEAAFKNPALMQEAVDSIYETGDQLGISQDESKKVVDRLMNARKDWQETGQVTDEQFRANIGSARQWLNNLMGYTEAGLDADLSATLEGEDGLIYRAMMYRMTESLHQGTPLSEVLVDAGVWGRSNWEQRLGSAEQKFLGQRREPDSMWPPDVKDMYRANPHIRFTQNPGEEPEMAYVRDGDKVVIWRGKDAIAEAYSSFKEWNGVFDDMSRFIEKNQSSIITSHPSRRGRKPSPITPGPDTPERYQREGGVSGFLGPEGPIEQGISRAWNTLVPPTAEWLGPKGPIEKGLNKAATGVADLLFGRKQVK